MKGMAIASSSTFHGFRFGLGILELDSKVEGKGILRMRWRDVGTRKIRKLGYGNGNGNRVCCKLQDGDNNASNNSSNGEPPESLFMKELRKRGISPTSLLEEINPGTFGDEIIKNRSDRSFSQRNSTATDLDKSLTNQRETSMALNSEGLEGLFPRAKVLLRLGGTFFLAFWPLILVTVASFAALYLYFGPTFVHDGSTTPIAKPQYIDPYVLLQEERITQ